ncbi:MAG: hypothetical protein JSW27_22910 [Phycisphaerales bacterium]|nr:MAG: hypothetical protein JSW27_22910 [Phycisphaerales bacterium]
MVEILKSFEQVAVRLSPIVLVLPGLASAALGLFIWLGGLGFRLLLLALMGALTGAFCSLWIVGQNPAAMVLLGLLGTAVAVVFQRFFTAALLGGLVGIAVFLMVAWPSLAVLEKTLVGRPEAEDSTAALSVEESLDMIRVYTLDVTDAIERGGTQLEASRWAVVAATVLTLLLVGLLFRHAGAALTCAILGTEMIFAGLILLLLFKGSRPVARIEARAPFFGLVFVAMVVFGTLEQWILCRRADRRAQGETKKSRSRKEQGKRSWRGR